MKTDAAIVSAGAAVAEAAVNKTAAADSAAADAAVAAAERCAGANVESDGKNDKEQHDTRWRQLPSTQADKAKASEQHRSNNKSGVGAITFPWRQLPTTATGWSHVGLDLKEGLTIDNGANEQKRAAMNKVQRQTPNRFTHTFSFVQRRSMPVKLVAKTANATRAQRAGRAVVSNIARRGPNRQTTKVPNRLRV